MVDDKVDGDRHSTTSISYSRGHIALEQCPGSKVEFSSIEIKELSTTTPPAQPTPPSQVANAIPSSRPASRRRNPMPPRRWTADGFRILFNGRDLQGWKPHPAGKGRWTVEDGILVGRGLDQSHSLHRTSEITPTSMRGSKRGSIPEETAGSASGQNSSGSAVSRATATKHRSTARIRAGQTGSLMHFGASGTGQGNAGQAGRMVHSRSASRWDVASSSR